MTPTEEVYYALLELRRPGWPFEADRPAGKTFKENLASALVAYGVEQCKWFKHPNGDSQLSIPLELLPHETDSVKEQDDFTRIKHKLEELKSRGVSLVVVLLPDKDANTYAILKRAGDIAVGFQTLCTVSGESGPKTEDDFHANLVINST